MKGLCLFLAFVLATSVVSAFSKNQEILNKLKSLNKPAVKSIKSSDGDIIDCVKLADQPAFDHPLLKNHRIQLSPTSNPEQRFSNKSKQTNVGEGSKGIIQLWHLSGSCPEGTIPIKRTKKSDILREMSFANKNLSTKFYVEKGSEAAFGYVDGDIYGTKAYLDVWRPEVSRTFEFSKTQIWVIGGVNSIVDSIEAGWHVSQQINGDKQTRLFILWTNNGYKSGCYNIQCSGFVQVNKEIALGSSLSPMSTYGDLAKQYVILIHIFKDPQTGNWWLRFEDKDLGYWPGSLFSVLQRAATRVQWGGAIENHNFNFQHTKTEMGSGYFAEEGPGKASFIANIQLVNQNNELQEPSVVAPQVTRPECYSFQMGPFDPEHSNMGTHFYYGGPGRSQHCV